MKIFACYCLHYGAEWLRYSMRSVADSVHEIHVFYTPVPSFGYQTNIPLPAGESRLDLLSLINKHRADDPNTNVFWHDCPTKFPHEGAHRDYAEGECAKLGADVILRVDADELWDAEHLEWVLDLVRRDWRNNACKKFYRVEFMHFWRSLSWVCHDPAMPARIFVPNASENEWCIGGLGKDGNYTNGPDDSRLKVYHMGYAQTPTIIKYKQEIHGHKGEWRPGWFENTFLPWKPGNVDVHPTNLNFWSPIRYNDDGRLWNLAADHPYFDLEVDEVIE